MDLDTGYLRDTNELKNIYSSDPKPAFAGKDFLFYKVRVSDEHPSSAAFD